MKSNFAKVGILGGLIFIIAGITRYTIAYHDPSEAIEIAIIGSLICAVSILYDRWKQHDLAIYALEEREQDRWLEENK